MRFVGLALAVGLAGTAGAQIVPELAAYGTFGQRWRDGGRNFTGATLALGVSSPASNPGPGVGLRLALTGFPTRDRNPNVVCVVGPCIVPEESFLLTVTQATAVLIPYRTRDVEFELGVGASQTETPFRDDRTGMVLTAALSGRVRELTRMQLGYERHLGPNSPGSDNEAHRSVFRHLIRVGLVYGGTRKQ